MEREEIIEKYGDVELKFSSYYKYSFMFSGKAKDGEDVLASVGGSSEDIYKLTVTPDRKETLKSLCPNYINITKCEEKIADWNDY